MGKDKCGSHAWGKKEVRELYASYSENNIYNSGMFKPLTRNLVTGAILNRGHHCERCQGKMSQSCYDEFHYGYCPTWVTRKGKRERCGERFCFHSNGCGKHPRIQGFNEALFRAANGGHVELSAFDDSDPQKNNGEADEDDGSWEAEMKAVEALAEAYLAEHGYLPASFYTDYFAGRTRIQAEEQKAQKNLAKDTLISAPGEKDEAYSKAVISNGNIGAGKKAKNNLNVTWAPGTRQNGGQVRKNGNTYVDLALTPGDTNLPGTRRSHAPKRSKQKAPMEAPRGPAEAPGVKETKADRAKKMVGKVFRRVNGA